MDKALIEATLFLAGDPIDLDSISNIIQKNKSETKKILEEMIEDRKKEENRIRNC